MLEFLQKTLQTIHSSHDNGLRVYYGVTEDTKQLLLHSDGSIPFVRDISAVEDNILSLYGIIKTLYRTTLTLDNITDIDVFVNQNFWLSFDSGVTVITASLRKDLSRYKTVLRAYWLYLETE
jgi:hypothetical protein